MQNSLSMILFDCKWAVKNFIASNLSPRPPKEVLIAQYHKLPDQIQVSWFRDDGFIIGNIDADGHKYMTQALSAKEFVERVNDTLCAVYDIPQNCLNVISRYKRYEPSPEEYKDLNDIAIKESKISLVREKELALA
jgi:hypothetical protein